MPLLLDLAPPSRPWPPPPPPPFSLDALGIEDGVVVVIAVAAVLFVAWLGARYHFWITDEELEELEADELDEEDRP